MWASRGLSLSPTMSQGEEPPVEVPQAPGAWLMPERSWELPLVLPWPGSEDSIPGVSRLN